MKTIIAGFVIAVVLVVPPAFADNLFIEAGPGFFRSSESDVFFLRYQKETSRLFGLRSCYDFFGAYWNGEYRDAAIGAARAISLETGKEQDFSPAFGFVVLESKTEHLGTSLQFYFRFAYDFKIKGRDVSFAVVHMSNGKLIFGWDGPNTGENFITFSVGLF